jgi:hypothetical protein
MIGTVPARTQIGARTPMRVETHVYMHVKWQLELLDVLCK